MADADRPSERVRALLRDAIYSYEKLEILMLLPEAPDQEWTVDAISLRARLPTLLIAPLLQALSNGSLAFLLIIAGIIHKNRASRGPRRSDA